jgi:stearoyl-CoA desaturase (delta-9 desaturase)
MTATADRPRVAPRRPPAAVAATPQTRAAKLALVASNLPFILMHAAVLLVIWAGVSWQAVAFCAAMYAVRMFAITAGYHRYFSHKTYRTSRAFQFLMGLLGTTALQKGPLWWSAHHRHHHRHSDDEHDVHSPTRHGFWWAHMGWIMSQAYDDTEWERIKDLRSYPELRWLNRWHAAPFVAVCALVQLTMGFQMLVWGCFISTVLLWHGTYTINSLCHLIGRRVYKTTDTSRNSMLLALVTLGEGWHNNHHYYPASANQGFHWWQIDISYYALWTLEKLGVIWDLKRAPAEVVAGQRGRQNYMVVDPAEAEAVAQSQGTLAAACAGDVPPRV